MILGASSIAALELSGVSVVVVPAPAPGPAPAPVPAVVRFATDGKPKIILSPEEIEFLLDEHRIQKIRRDDEDILVTCMAFVLSE